MKKYARWTAIAVASPFILFFILSVLIYLPPVQNFLVDTAMRYASSATGMHISIKRISLKFPLDLVVNQTLVVDKKDTILNAQKLTVSVQLMPLLHQEVELDGMRLEGARVNTAGLIEGMTLRGKLDDMFVAAHGADLAKETLIVDNLQMENAHLALCFTDTLATDTTETDTLRWKIKLHEAQLNKVRFRLDMPMDSLCMTLGVGKATLKEGDVDLYKSAYAASSFSIEKGSIAVDLNNDTISAQGLDYNHLRFTDLNFVADSLYYGTDKIRAFINKFTLKERSGLEVVSTKGHLLADDQAVHIPLLKITTQNSDLELQADADWNLANMNKNAKVRARLMANIGKNDLMKALPHLPQDVVKSWPAVPISIKAGVDGTLKRMKITAMTLNIPDVFRAEMSGEMTNLTDSLKRTGNVTLSAEAGNMNFMKALTGGFVIPHGTKLNADAQLNGSRAETNVALIPLQAGRMSFSGNYDMLSENYKAVLSIDTLDLHAFLPQDSLYKVIAKVEAEGKGFDFFSTRTYGTLKGDLFRLEYGHRRYSGVSLFANIKECNAIADLNINDYVASFDAHLTALLHPSRVSAELTADLQRLKLMSMGITAKECIPSLHLEARAGSDMKKHHGVRVSVTDIRVKTEKQSFKTKDLHAGLELATDSVRSFVNAGDLTFLFRSNTGWEHFMRDVDRYSAEMEKQWKKKVINQKLLQELLPDARLRILAGADNPAANMLATTGMHFDKINSDIRISPHTGVNGAFNLYGLRTDSLKLDTIYIHAHQQADTLFFDSGIKALANKWQEAFNASLHGFIGSTDALARVEYFNGRGEKGVDLGLRADLHDKGIILRVAPETATILYRPFMANAGNYVFLSDAGKIFADLKLHDKDNTGISLFSTPDSLALQDLTFGIHRVDIGELRRVVPYMPQIAGFINAEAHYVQMTDDDMQVAMDVSVNNLAYNKQPLGNWGMNAVYLPGEHGEHCIDGFVTLDGEEVMSLGGSYLLATEEQPDDLKATLTLNHFPLHTANAFIPYGMARMGGDVDGSMSVSGSTEHPLLNGTLILDSVSLAIPQASLNLRFDNRPVAVENSKMQFNDFSIFTKGRTPFTINGTVDIADVINPRLDLRLFAQNFELINARRTRESLVHGKLYVDFNSTLRGTPDALRMRGNMNVLGKSNFTYVLKDSPLTVEDRLGETVTFVDFNDTTTFVRPSETISLGGLDMLMTMHIDEAVQARIDLNESGSNYMLLEGGGDLSFQYEPDGDMLLNGRYSLISGEMKYEMPVIPLKTFKIQEGSYIEWAGNLMNPLLNIKATERVRASVPTSSGSQSTRMVNFDVGVNMTNRLENLGFTFTLEAPDDGTMQNELAAKSGEEKNKLAVTMLVTGMYMDENSTAKGINANSMLNSFLQGEINKAAGNALKSIDINFGMETTDDDNDGTSRTDYKLQFAKRFWNNRFQVVIGGKISTGNDAQQQQEAFIDNISLEYRLDNSGTRYVKLFHDKNYESILDGEVIETGVGLVLRRKVSKLGQLFIFRPLKKKKKSDKNKQEVLQKASATEKREHTEPQTDNDKR